MSKVFNHTTQPLGSTTSPVEDLALEVEDAFTSIEKAIDVSNTVIENFGETFGNPTLESLEGHGVTKSVSEVHNMLPHETNIVLKNVPNPGSITLSYLDNTGSTVSLEEIPYDQDFTDKNQYKVSGKYLVLNIRVPEHSSVSVNATYSTKTFTLGGKKFLSNVVSKEDGTFELTPVLVSGNTYKLDYETQIKNNPEKHFEKTLKFFIREVDQEEYKRLIITSYNYEDTYITLTSNDLPTDLSTVKVLAFAQNTDISELLNALYKEFREHSHSKNDLTHNIETSDLVNRYINTDKINYKDDTIPNYAFPQYFNREGYNSNLDAVYENAILGDVFISRVISDTVQKFKGLDADSNSLIFADPVRGHRFKYSRQDEALTLTSLAEMNGLKIISENPDHYNLALNESTLKSSAEGMKINPENKILLVRSGDASDPYLVDVDKLKSDTSELTNLKSEKISINDIDIIAHSDGSSAEFTSEGKDKKVIFSTPVLVDKLTVNNLVSPHDVTFKAINTDWLKLGEIHYKVDDEHNLHITDEGAEKDNSIIYKLPTKYEGRMTAHHISPNTINFGNVVFNVDDTTLGLNIFSTVPDQSSVNFKSKVKFENGLEVSKAKGNFQVGDVHFDKNDNSESVTVSSSEITTELLFSTQTRFKKLKTDEDSDVNIYRSNFNKAYFGKVLLAQEDENLHIKHSDSNSPGKVEVEVPINLVSATYNSLEGPKGSKAVMDNLEVSSLTIGGVVISNNGTLVPGTTTPGTIASPNTPGATLSFAAKVKAEELDAKQANIETLTSDAATIKALKIGNGTFSPDTDNNVTLTSTVDGTKFKVQIDSEFENLTVKNLISPKSSVNISETDKLIVGKAVIQKDDENVVVDRLGPDTTLKLQLPVEADNFIATNFGTTNNATLKHIFGDTMTINGVVWSSDKDGNSLMTSEDTEKKFNFSIPTTFEDVRGTLASALEYKLSPGDKIAINNDNYITNFNGKYTAHLAKGFNYVGSGRDTGVKFSLTEDGLPVLKQYISSNTGTAGADSEKNAFIEVGATDGLYFLQPTDKKIQHKGEIYGFNDSSAQTNISDLRRWLRAPLFAGAVEADSLKLGFVDGKVRNGFSIGETRISVIGPNTDCPTGLTTFESADGIHFTTPLAADNTCRNLTYQEVNTGPLTIKGDGTTENSFTITEDLMVGGTASANYLDVTGEASLSSLKVSENLTVTGEGEFKNAVTIANTLSVASSATVKGDVEAQNFKSTRDFEVGRDLRVTNDAYVTGDTVIEGSLSISKGFQTNGLIKGTGVETDSLKANSGEILTNFKVAGETQVGGRLNVGSSVDIIGNVNMQSNLEVKESFVAKNIYSIHDVTVREKFSVFGASELNGATIQIGTDSSKTQINGKLSINTDLFSVNSPTRIFNTLKVTESAEFSSTILAKSGITTDAGVTAKGTISTESNIEVGATITTKSAEVTQDLRVGSSVTANNLTAESIVIQQRAAINNLSISGSLSMPTDTTIVVGDVKASVYTQTDSNATSSFAGNLYVSKKLEAANDVKISGTLTFDNGEFQISTLGIKGKDAVVDVNKIRAEVYTGTNRIQPPPELRQSGNTTAGEISNIISSATNYMRMENSLFEGITVFARPVVAGTIYYTDLISVKESSHTGNTSSVDLTARRALYS